MRIAVDARELIGRPTGVGRYLEELIASWSRDPAARGARVSLYAPGPLALRPGLVGSGGAAITTEQVAGGRGTRWEQTTLPWAVHGQADVLFCPGYSAPLLSRVPVVVAIHDLSFFAHPEWFTWREGLRRRGTTAAAARRAMRILTISQFSRGEILRWLRVPAARVHVTYLAPARRLAGSADAPSASQAPRPREPMVLYVGSLLNRRNLPTLVRAFAPVGHAQPAARLVIVGDNRTFPHQDPVAIARSLGIDRQVEVRSYVADEDLAALYRRASAFAFLSEYEGFGLTPLEAMSAEVPVVAYDTPVAREVYGDAAWLVPPGDTDAISSALRSVMEDSAARARLLTAAEACLSRWSWDHTARTTLDVLTDAGSRRSV